MNFKIIGMFTVLIAIGGYVYYQRTQLNTAREEIITAVTAQQNAIAERDLALGAAKTNLETIYSLLAERKHAEAAYVSLQAEQKKIKANIAALDEIVKSEELNPINIVAAPPVVKNIISSIQADRKNRKSE